MIKLAAYWLFRSFAVLSTGIVGGFLVTMMLMALHSCQAEAAETSQTWFVVSGVSYHYDRDKKHNETNTGLGLEHHFARDWTVAGGFYENSYWDTSWYAGLGWTPLHWGKAHFGLATGAVTGYPGKTVGGYLFPVMAIQGKSFGVNVGIVPSRDEAFTVIGAQMKWRFR